MHDPRGRVRRVRAGARGRPIDATLPSHSCPTFSPAVAVVARTIGVSVGEVSCRLLALGPPPHAPTLAKLSAKDYGASVGHVDDPNEAFKLDVFESDVDDLASTGLSTPDVTRGTHRPVFGATDKREAIERARACFRCLDVAHTGLVRLQELVTILGQSGAFDHLDLNAAAVWLESRLGSLSAQQGNVVKYNQFADEVTLVDVGRHVRAVLRYHPPKGTESIQTPVNVDEAHVNKENIAVASQRVRAVLRRGSRERHGARAPPAAHGPPAVGAVRAERGGVRRRVRKRRGGCGVREVVPAREPPP